MKSLLIICVMFFSVNALAKEAINCFERGYYEGQKANKGRIVMVSYKTRGTYMISIPEIDRALEAKCVDGHIEQRLCESESFGENNESKRVQVCSAVCYNE